ncbi:hypothetical protein ACIQ7D_30150 [Streptomyces sp. NPDC096310]|uniref:hypothetical protein n=1 Tax=Streptomyces sp. NPDC096310 TaxID=3366082 RepID=UPI003808F727
MKRYGGAGDAERKGSHGQPETTPTAEAWCGPGKDRPTEASRTARPPERDVFREDHAAGLVILWT